MLELFNKLAEIEDKSCSKEQNEFKPWRVSIEKWMAKKLRILTAAEEIMSLKGLATRTISEIAQRAEVVESVIIQFYKGKEICFSRLPGERMKRSR